MKISSTIELVWHMAAQEAIAGKFKEIEPEHFCIATLKFSELPLEELEKKSPNDPEIKQAREEVNYLKKDIEGRQVDSTISRRRLRAILGAGDHPYEGGQIHRSQASRRLFESAARMAENTGSEVFMVRDLWSALIAGPTEAIVQALGDVAAKAKSELENAPTLNKQGRDLTRLAAQGDAPKGAAPRLSEGKALAQALSQRNRKNVLLVARDSDSASLIAKRVGQIMTTSDCPEALRNRRLFEVPARLAPGEDIDRALEKFEQIMLEASGAGAVLVFSSIVDNESRATAKELADFFIGALARDNIQFVWCVSPGTYETIQSAEAIRRKRVEVIWVSGESDRDIPNEL